LRGAARRFGAVGGIGWCGLLRRRVNTASPRFLPFCLADTRPGASLVWVLAEKIQLTGGRRRATGGKSLRQRTVSASRQCISLQKIIGRNGNGLAFGLPNGAGRIDNLSIFSTGPIFPLFHQQASKPGIRALLNIRIQQLFDLFAQIGCVIKSRQLIGLQGVSGRREEKIPGRLGRMVSSQGALQLPRLSYQCVNSGQWYSGWHGLWKSVENLRPILEPVNDYQPIPDQEIDDLLDALELRLLIERIGACCSACAGDYEDPERSQWPEPEGDADLLDDRVDRDAWDNRDTPDGVDSGS
jgi:hypothetical protein